MTKGPRGIDLLKGILRIARNQLDEALDHLTGPHAGSRDEAVCAARKSIKKPRAVLRLVRPAIDAKTYCQENTYLRDAGRPLSEVRDARTFIDTLDRLAEHFKEHVAGR
jgi:hypothetical protein